MIEISRALARRLRLVFRKSLPPGTTRGQRSPLSLYAGQDGLLIRSHHPEVVVAYHRPGPCSREEMHLPGEVLDDCAGRGNDAITLDTLGTETVRAMWHDGGVPQLRDYHCPDKEKSPPLPEEPKKLVPVEPGLLRALAEAALCSAREGSRFSLSKIQLKSKGEIVSTDGRQLLVQKGFSFPWEDDLLITALSVFGYKDLAADEQLFLGRTETHVCLRTGPWTIFLATDAGGRFPDVEAVIPSARSSTTTCSLSDEDAAFLVQALPRLPGKEGDLAPVTLDLNGKVAIRARSEGQEKTTELLLGRSTTAGPPVQVVCNRLYLGRAVQLGFRTIGVAKPSTPLVCREDRRVYMWMPLDPACALASTEHDLHISSTTCTLRSLESSPPAPTSDSHKLRKRRPAPVPHSDDQANGQHANGHSDTVPNLDDLIQEAETLRMTLTELCGRMGQLTMHLKRYRRRGKAIEAALSALRLKLPALP